MYKINTIVICLLILSVRNLSQSRETSKFQDGGMSAGDVYFVSAFYAIICSDEVYMVVLVVV